MQIQQFLPIRHANATSENFSHAFQRSGYTPQIAMEVPNIFSLINLVSEEMGDGLLSGRIGAFGSRIQLIAFS
jgi:LysR family malonate utilization transcriptional regulator